MYAKYVKRILDVIISLLCILILIPIYIVTAILIKFADKNQIIFMQNRTGMNGKEFKILKFRSMKNGKVTNLGKCIRNTSIDEIPQFINVLKGDMSIVGPRPWVPEYYKSFNSKQKQRALVRPRSSWACSGQW